MKASVRQQLALLELQEHDHSLARLARRRASLPERALLEELDLEVAAAKTSFMEAQRTLDEQLAEVAKIDDDVRLVTERKARDEQLLSASTSPKEAQALQAELETLGRRQRELEDRELELMQAGEDAQGVFDQAQGVLDGVDSKRSEILAQISTAEQAIDRDIEQLRDARAGTAAEIQGDLLEEYEQIRARVGVGAARLRGNVSEASNMALTPAELSDIADTDPEEIVYCPGTGAILVRADPHTADS